MWFQCKIDPIKHEFDVRDKPRRESMANILHFTAPKRQYTVEITFLNNES